jgi:predicted metal-dependent phosphoesterase TrpH
MIDLHIHTKAHSSCSRIDPRDLVFRALEIGLSGIAIVEHGYAWKRSEIENLRESAGSRDLLILRGQEVECELGHLLVFGYYDRIPPGLDSTAIVSEVHENSGLVFVAHPFRSGGNMGLEPEKLRDRFQNLDGIEVLNSNHSVEENAYALSVWKSLDLVGIGGSDAHSIDRVGSFVTRFSRAIRNEEDLMSELRAGRCEPTQLRTHVG